MPYSDTGTSAYEHGTSRAPFLLAQAPAGMPAPTATIMPGVSPLRALPPAEWQQLSANEKADNQRFERIHNQLATKGVDCGRVSWHWPESFFKSEGPGRPKAATHTGELLCTYYAGRGSAILVDFYENQDFFQSWDEGQIDKAHFVFRKGDVLVFNKGHSMIVVGDNLYDDVVISQMSWNRTRQQYDAQGLDANGVDFYARFKGLDDYGVTRDRLKDLQNPRRCPPVMRAIFQTPLRIYRLKRYLGNYTVLQIFDQSSELVPNGTKFNTHIIKQGETLSRIAKQYGRTIDNLIEANGIKPPAVIYAGDELIIP